MAQAGKPSRNSVAPIATNSPSTGQSKASARTLTTDDICELFDIDTTTVKRWVKKGCPCDRPGKGKARAFNDGEVASWMKEHRLTGKVGHPIEQTTPDLLSARTRKEMALAEKHEIAVRQLKGTLLSKDEVEEGRVARIQAVRGKLLGLAASLSPVLVGLSVAEIQHAIDERMRNTCDEFAGNTGSSNG